jgi:hypothetical protein
MLSDAVKVCNEGRQLIDLDSKHRSLSWHHSGTMKQIQELPFGPIKRIIIVACSLNKLKLI